MSYNKAILIGRIGQDPESKTINSGNHLLKFSLATSRNWKDKQGEWQQETQWHRCQIWGKLAEALSTVLGKGDLVAVDGEIKYGQYEAQDGTTKYTTDIVCQSVKRLQKNEKENNQTYDQNAGFAKPKKAEPVAEAVPWGDDDGEDDLPF